VTLTGLAVILGLLAACAAVLGVVLVATSNAQGSLGEIGKWLLQAALLFTGTGVVSILVRQSELTRVRRDAWAELLQQLIAAYDSAQLAARLMSAHATAQTYSEQIMVLTSIRVAVRRLASAPEVQDDEPLHNELQTMRRYLKKLIKEYRDNYLPVARQQRLDEAVLSYRLKKLAEGDRSLLPTLPEELSKPLPAGLALQDAHRFPVLNEFRENFKFSEFRTSYVAAKRMMQQKAGMPVNRAD
jgi:hypothetical protein